MQRTRTTFGLSASPAEPVTRSLVVRAPAKVNLRLLVLGKRADGYHELDSLMFAVSLYDTLAISATRSARSRVSCRVSGPEKVAGGPSNLAARAALAVLGELGVSARIDIRLRKEIPFGAGLGGGSSDAAAVLRTLPGLLGSRIPRARLARVAARLGADVPFFLSCRPARARGIGERLTPLGRAPRGGLVIAVPDERVDTAWAYRNALSRLTSGRSASKNRRLPRSLDAVEAWVFNDFQRGVEKAVESVRLSREALLGLGARAAVLTGSGSAVVGLFANARSAAEAAARYRGPGKARAASLVRSAPRPELRRA